MSIVTLPSSPTQIHFYMSMYSICKSVSIIVCVYILSICFVYFYSCSWSLIKIIYSTNWIVLLIKPIYFYISVDLKN